MPLASSTLRQGLFAVMNSYPPTILEAARGFASAYGAYAAAGTFLAGTLPSVAAQQATMAQMLFGAMQGPVEAAAYATAWAAALSAFWVGVPVAGPNAGLTIGCPGATAAQSAILASLTAMPGTVLQAAQDLAAALHTATLTVTATVSLPGPPFTSVVPIL